MLDKDRMTFIWNEYKDQNDCQRHNETQRSQLTSILLAISAALLAFLPKDRPLSHYDLTLTTFLILIGVFGMLAIMKYWERFMYHVKIERGYRKVLDSYFISNGDEKGGEEQGVVKGVFLQTREDAIKEHKSHWFPLFTDRYLMQHWLWEGVVGIITMVGIYLTIRAWSN
jgi:hypothetical protein